MKALTIRQPWASLIAAGVKTIETRSWSTKYRGPLAIHAGKASTLEGLVDLEDGWEFIRLGDWSVGRAGAGSEAATGMMEMYGPDGSHFDLSFGAVVATCTLADVVPVFGPLPDDVPPGRHVVQRDRRGLRNFDPHRGFSWDATDQLPFGDFTPGRYAWLLTGIEPCEPIPAKGRQGLWEWTP